MKLTSDEIQQVQQAEKLQDFLKKVERCGYDANDLLNTIVNDSIKSFDELLTIIENYIGGNTNESSIN
jgi:hypothetical protein